MTKRKSTPVYLEESDKEKLATIAGIWGVSQSAAVQRLIREKEFSGMTRSVVNQIEVTLLPFVEILEISKLPLEKGVYLVVNNMGQIVYVGKAEGARGLKGRWTKDRAKKYFDKGATQVRFVQLKDIDPIDSIEAELIQRFNPSWNIHQMIGNSRPNLEYLDDPEWKLPEEIEFPE